MPAKSQAQRGLIFSKRDQYKTKAKTPKKWKWVWDEDFENKGKLPKKVTEGQGFEETTGGDAFIDELIAELQYQTKMGFDEAERYYNKYYEFVADCYGDEMSAEDCADALLTKAEKELEETVQNVVFNESNTRALFINEEDIYGDPYVSDTTSPTPEPERKQDRMKDPAVVREGDKTLDYNDEEGEVVDIFMYDNDPDMFEEIVTGEWGADLEDFSRDTYIVYVKSPTNGPFGGQGAVWYVYGRDGAYVPEYVNEDFMGGLGASDGQREKQGWGTPSGMSESRNVKPEELIGLKFAKMEYNEKSGNLDIFPEDQSGHYEIGCSGGAMLGVYHPIPYEPDTIRAIKPATDIGDIAIFFEEHPWIVLEDDTGGEGIEIAFIYG